MRQSHQGAFSDVQLRVLADRNARAVEPLFESCPFCGLEDDSQGGTITEHIVGHLRFLALKSLPPYQDEGSEISDGDSATSQASKHRNRSTIDNDPDRLKDLIFGDSGSDTAIEVPSIQEIFNNPVSERRVSLTNRYPTLPNVEWDGNFDQGPPTGSKNLQENERQLEWGFVTVNLEQDTDVNDPVLRDLFNKQTHLTPVMDRSKQAINTGDTDNDNMHSMHEIPDEKGLVPTKDTRRHPSSESDTDWPSDANPAFVAHHEGNEDPNSTDSSSEKPLGSILPECVQGEDRPESSSLLLPVANAVESHDKSPPPSPLHRDSLNMGHKDVTPMQLSGEVSAVSDAPSTHSLSEAILSPAYDRESILVNSSLVGPLRGSPLQAPKPKENIVDNTVLDEMIARLLGLVDTSSMKSRKRLFGLSKATSIKKSPCITGDEIELICNASRELFLSQPTLLELAAPVKVVGDIHGQYIDLIRLFQLCGFPPTTNYLFLGDYVDRGKHGLETILLLLCYKLRYPENFFLLRGNHECASVTRVYGFYDECKRRTNIKTWKKFVDVFNCMPIAALVASKIFCVHGGLSPSLNHMEDIRQIARPSDIPDYGLLNDLLWSDPADTEEDWEPNDRGVSYCFGKEVIKNFLQRHEFDLICRAHMVVEDGYEFYHDRLLVTIFSAPNVSPGPPALNFQDISMFIEQPFYLCIHS